MQLPVRLTMREARATSAALGTGVAAAPRGSRLAVDATALQELDTAALAVLLQAQRDAQARGVTLVVEGTPPQLRRIAALYGVEALLGLAPPETDG
jgi:phospholipid transport system transporter-binding protein